MKSAFKLITATLLVGLSAVAFSASLEAGALGDTVGGAVGGATGAVGGALGGVGGALGGNSSSTSGGSTTAGAGVGTAVGNTTAKASVVLRKKNFAKNQVTVTLGKTTNVNAKALSGEIDVSLGLTAIACRVLLPFAATAPRPLKCFAIWRRPNSASSSGNARMCLPRPPRSIAIWRRSVGCSLPSTASPHRALNQP